MTKENLGPEELHGVLNTMPYFASITAIMPQYAIVNYSAKVDSFPGLLALG